MLATVHKAKAKRDDWCTPAHVVAAVHEAFGGLIDLDPCGNDRSIVGALREFRLPEVNGLVADWSGVRTIFVNPPFGEGLSKWVGRCVHARREFGAEVILLLPAAIETSWWHDMIFPTATAVLFPRGRIEFDPPEQTDSGGAPMACALVYWGANQAPKNCVGQTRNEKAARVDGRQRRGSGMAGRWTDSERAQLLLVGELIASARRLDGLGEHGAARQALDSAQGILTKIRMTGLQADIARLTRG